MGALPPLRFSVSIETMFLNMPFEQRMEHVAAQGFSAFEFGRRDGKDMNITLALQTALRMEVSAFIGSSASLVDPTQHTQFENDILRAASLAVDLCCSYLIIHSGAALPGVLRPQQRANIIAALQRVVPIARDADVILVLEPLNRLDNPGTFLYSSDEGFQLIREVNSPHVRLLYSIYHQQISEGNLARRISDNLDLIGYIHAADVPGRHEPGTGEINYNYLFRLLRQKQYQGYVGLDYIPRADVAAGLRVVRAMNQ